LPRYLVRLRWVVLLFCLSAGMAIAFAARFQTGPATIAVTVDNDILPANGYTEARLQVRASDGRELPRASWRIATGSSLIGLGTPTASDTVVRAGVTPGDIVLVANASGFSPARIHLRLELDPTDQFGDGTPDFLRLQDEDDQVAFRRWFAFLAESVYFEKEQDRPPDVNDCAALIRFAYREALRRHDGPWANQWHLPWLPNTASVRKYDYPHTALGAGLFRTQPGAFAPENATDGAFAQFADAESLRLYNTHFVSRDLHAARQGDLLFFRQAGHRMPFHTMIFLGSSYFGDGADWLIYHTGPSEAHAGEMRRVTVNELRQHPEARWRPLPQNPAFLGVYRWNILREED
jgi:uncharacterized protein YfaT (DUF1175 family)